MRVTDVIKPYDLLCESLSTDFTIGFELEAVASKDKWQSNDEYNSLPGYHSGNAPEGVYKRIFDYLNSSLGLGNGKIERDGSLQASNRGDLPFEYGSPIIHFNPTNVSKIYHFLSDLKNNGIYTNSTCGFHIHMSVPTITKADIAWIICCIAIDSKLTDLVTKLHTTEEGDIDLYQSTYARTGFLEDIKDYLEYDNGTRLDNYKNNISSLIRNDKYRVLNIHGQGTLEWRGPRGFLNNGKESSLKEFIVSLYTVIKCIGQILDKQTYKGDKVTINRSEISKLQSINTFDSPIEKREREKEENKRKYDSPLHPRNLSKLTPEIVKNDLSKYDIKQFIMDVAFEKPVLFNKIKKNTLETMFLRLDTWDIREILRHIYESDQELFKRLFGNCSENLRKVIFDTFIDYLYSMDCAAGILKILDFNNEDFYNWSFKQIADNNITQLFSMLDNLKNHGINVSLDNKLFAVIADNNIEAMYTIKDIPVSIQRRMIRKNPYNIQYIRYPDKVIVDYLKKTTPDALDYMVGDY